MPDPTNSKEKNKRNGDDALHGMLVVNHEDRHQ